MHNGNDPVRLFRELSTLGELTVRCDPRQLPHLAKLKPEDCYLSWELELQGTVSHEELVEVFAWVEDDCDLRIEALAKEPTASNPVVARTPGEEGQQGELLLERRKSCLLYTSRCV